MGNTEWPNSSYLPFAACAFGSQSITDVITEMKPTNSCVSTFAFLLYALLHLRK